MTLLCVPHNELILAQLLYLNVSKSPTTIAILENYALDVCSDYFACRNLFVTDVEVLDSHLLQPPIDFLLQWQ
jgi:hypothetical protein